MKDSSASPTPPVRRQFYTTLEAKSLRSRSLPTKISDSLTAKTSTPLFLFINFICFFLWILANLGVIPGITPFDPFPFGLLTMFVSLEAIFLSIFVLISQARAAQIATLREELHLRINLIAEQEVTKSLEILAAMRKKMGITDEDPELEHMLLRINKGDLEHAITEQLERADESLFKQIVINPFAAKNKK